MNKLTVYSMIGCAQCIQAANWLSTKDIPHEVVKLEDSPEAWELMKKDGRRSMPQIYLNGSLFVEGGFQGLSKMSADTIKAVLRHADDADAQMSKEETMKKLEG